MANYRASFLPRLRHGRGGIRYFSFSISTKSGFAHYRRASVSGDGVEGVTPPAYLIPSEPSRRHQIPGGGGRSPHITTTYPPAHPVPLSQLSLSFDTPSKDQTSLSIARRLVTFSADISYLILIFLVSSTRIVASNWLMHSWQCALLYINRNTCPSKAPGFLQTIFIIPPWIMNYGFGECDNACIDLLRPAAAHYCRNFRRFLLRHLALSVPDVPDPGPGIYPFCSVSSKIDQEVQYT